MLHKFPCIVTYTHTSFTRYMHIYNSWIAQNYCITTQMNGILKGMHWGVTLTKSSIKSSEWLNHSFAIQKVWDWDPHYTTMVENRPKCLIVNFGLFHQFCALLKLAGLVTLFSGSFSFSKSSQIDHFWHFQWIFATF